LCPGSLVRNLCKALRLTGETQVIDRILLAFSNRYWDANENYRDLYKSADIIHVIVYSLVLLNTDMHVVNASLEKSKRRMTKSEFVNNTYSLIEHIIREKDEETLSSKKWKTAITSLLKEFYDAIKDSALDLPVSSIEKATPTVLASDEKCRSATSLSRLKLAPSESMTFFPLASELEDSDSLAPATSSSLPRRRESAQTEQKRNRYTIYQGQLMRKHFIERDQIKAKQRKWQSFWCTFAISEENGLELAMWKTLDSTTNLSTLDSEDELSQRSRSFDELGTSRPKSQSKVPFL
jgi:hypothetical protein